MKIEYKSKYFTTILLTLITYRQKCLVSQISQFLIKYAISYKFNGKIFILQFNTY